MDLCPIMPNVMLKLNYFLLWLVHCLSSLSLARMIILCCLLKIRDILMNFNCPLFYHCLLALDLKRPNGEWPITYFIIKKWLRNKGTIQITWAIRGNWTEACREQNGLVNIKHDRDIYTHEHDLLSWKKNQPSKGMSSLIL